uniref:Uncharacterized protein n=1 Tax=Anguilla anguilla TaxID=7936 RepID=A0A0E9U272_ANGAN
MYLQDNILNPMQICLENTKTQEVYYKIVFFE